MFHRVLLIGLLATMATPIRVRAQNDVAAEPIVGLRDNRPTDYAFVHATVIAEPGRQIDDATLLVRGTTITEVGRDIEVPPGFMTIDCTDKHIYPGLIDAYSEIDVERSTTQPGYWNSHVTPERSAASKAADSLSQSDKLRKAGITARVIAPRGGIVKGNSCVVLLSESRLGRRLLQPRAWYHLQLTVPRGGSGPRYPNSPMGAIALLRQSMYDARWYGTAWEAYRANPELPRPETNIALEELSAAIANDTFVVDAPNERMAVRAHNLAHEFLLKIIVRGSGREYRALDEIAAAGHPVLVPINFPDTPDVKTSQRVRNTSLRELMHWDLAPENPSRLADADVTFCLTTDGLDNVDQFRKQIGKAIDRGLDPDDALAAVTTTPARLLGIDRRLGRIRPGMLANLVITDGALFDRESEVLECWVAGEQFVTSDQPNRPDPLNGSWRLTLQHDNSSVALTLKVVSKSEGKVTATMAAASSSDDEPADPVELKNVATERDRLTGTIPLDEVDASMPAGVARLTLMTVVEDEHASVFASLALPDGTTGDVTLERLDEADGEDDNDQAGEDDEAEKADDEDDTSDSPSDQDETEAQDDSATPVLFPLGGYGLATRITEQPTVMFRGATIWTCDQLGMMESADVLVRDGVIAEIGQNLAIPADCQIVDARSKHITPGLIDCHSHMGTDGGVNESGQAVTAEVRIGDFIDNSDINIYRHLAGGVTTSNILHGSANPIGGQNQVIKLRWGETMDALRMAEAPPGIKFALGENVVRNTSRYPNSRMGVQQIMRDQLLAAREYHARQQRWSDGDRSSLPPRTDLQLEAMAEVQRGERWIHCHSYRQDEIVATLDLLEEFGIQIGTLQHILEGYKVADRMARHGAMGSAFSDWWAYKFEVYDAIPYNGALMHDRGVIVSFNSDDRELARHLNAEAAKATKYGGVPEQEALKFVTLNPARQLRIDKHVGSLAVGKHADLVIWSGRPLSTLTRCEQVWIDGRQYFSLESDQKLQQRDARLRARLIQKALVGRNQSKSASKKKEVAEEDRWVRTDVYCATHGGLKHAQGDQP